MAPAGGELVQVTDVVHIARTDLVNWTVVIDGDGVLLIDAGFPGQRAEVLATLSQLGVGPGDVHSILLTHAHIDHAGGTGTLARERTEASRQVATLKARSAVVVREVTITGEPVVAS